MAEKKHSMEDEVDDIKKGVKKMCSCCSHMWFGLSLSVLVIVGSMFYGTHLLEKKIDLVVQALSKTQVSAPVAAAPSAPSVPTGPVTVNERSDAPVIGNQNAKVTIVEFSDFQCPYCTRFYKETFAKIKSTYIDTGKAKIVYRHFPLSFHPFAQKAAEAGECAARQGKFELMHDIMFNNSTSDGANLSVDKLKQYAKSIGLTTSTFNSCLDNSETASVIAKDTQDGQSAGVTGTPTFFINGKMVVGAQPFASFQQAIDEQLK